MCLWSKWIFPRKAKEDIVCYKVLLKKNREYITPFVCVNVTLGQILKAKGFSFWSFLFSELIGEGYIHAYTFKDCKIFCGKRPSYIFKAVIPKGTWYHISKDGWEICAKKMLITKELVD